MFNNANAQSENFIKIPSSWCQNLCRVSKGMSMLVD